MIIVVHIVYSFLFNVKHNSSRRSEGSKLPGLGLTEMENGKKSQRNTKKYEIIQEQVIHISIYLRLL